MASRAHSKWWQVLCGFCWGLRIGFLLICLGVAAAALYFNKVGFPDFLKRPLTEQLRDRGVDLQFSRLRWHSFTGFEIEDVRFGSAKPEPDVPQFFIKRVELKLNHHALLHLKLQVDRLILHDGQLDWPLLETNGPAALSVSNIQTQLEFKTNDQWDLNHFSAHFAGADFHLSGDLTNASAFRKLKIFQRHGPARPDFLHERLLEVAKAINRIQFSKPPELNVVLYADARRPENLNGLITLTAPGARTPWGTLDNGVLAVRLIGPGKTNGVSLAEFRLSADEARTPWGNTKQFQLDIHASGDNQWTNLIQARMELSTESIATEWAKANSARFSAHWTHSITNPIPIAGAGRLEVIGAETKWGGADRIQLDANLSGATNGTSLADPSWGWWARLQPYFLDWNCKVAELRSGDFESPEVVCGGSWRAPELTITNLHTEIYQGEFNANASLNVTNRNARFGCASDFDVQKASPFLTTGGREWFQRQQITWEKPPLAHAVGSVILPEWTNRHPDWRGEVLPTLWLQGDFKVGPASYRQVAVTSAQSYFAFSNVTWTLSDLVAKRPEGTIKLGMISNDRTKEFYFHVISDVDVNCVRPSLSANVQKVMDKIEFTRPPVLDAEIWGHGWHDAARLGFRARVAATNFSFRGESAAAFHGLLSYTNEYLVLTEGRIDRTNNEYMTASGLGVDVVARKGFLTNGFSNAEPYPMLRAIGKKVFAAVEPYQFAKPPTVSAYGVIPLSDDISVADLHFQVDGGPFKWLKFHLPHVAGNVDWMGQRLTLSQVQATFYNGKLTATAAFDFHHKMGTDFHFDTIITGSSLQALMADVSTGSNHLEGTLAGHLSITQANSSDPKSWFGKGNVTLADGLIWDMPIFGMFSPILDAISPGLGKSRVSEGSADFIITNSVIRAENLEVSSPTVRLFYRGTVGFDLAVDAVVEAQLGRNTPLLGPLVSTVLTPFEKLFEYKVTGTLTHPKDEPVILPVMLVTKLLNPFMHPFHTVKDFFVPPPPDTNGEPVVWPSNSLTNGPTTTIPPATPAK
jgi:hypothetical protein